MRKQLLSGAARSATLDDVMARLDKIEKENAELRHKVRELSAKPGAAAPVASDPSNFKGNPVLHAGVASNSSYFGVRARHNLAPYGWEGWSIVAQLEAQIDAAASPTERAAFGSRDSYVGLEGPWGAIKAGKSDTPYK